MMKIIQLSEELDKILIKQDISIDPIGKYQLQNWLDWLLFKTQKAVKKADILAAINNYEINNSPLT